MRFNHFLLPLMAGSVVSAPVREPEPKHQLEARMNVGTVVTSGAAVCVACVVGVVAYKSYTVAASTLEFTKGQYRIASAKYSLDKASIDQAMKIANDNQQHTIGKSMILEAEKNNKVALGFRKRIVDIQKPYLAALVADATQYPLTQTTSQAIPAAQVYCGELEKLLDQTTDIIEDVINRSPKTSPAGSAQGSPSRSTSPDGRNPTSVGTTGLTRTNSQSGRPPSSGGSVSPTNDRGRTQSVVSSGSAGSAGTQDLSKAEKGKAGIPQQNPPTSQGKTSGASVPAPGPAAGLTRRPTEGQLRRTGSTASLKSGTKTLRRRMVPLVVFDV
ncbi:hypothetical protein OOU_Y34scaffold00522g67 [Pyricularia oryzae Y34]|uniref:Uncharacterized protein n=2 Tax=Pyricularia oryzae TaxID=318829 RepID=A0AA97PLC4_PYRO3|nr:hypothetical protein OOU_Y34scaffold00522g67 [Pyricularia oryzae Y34]